jgi:hypothetical protein
MIPYKKNQCCNYTFAGVGSFLFFLLFRLITMSIHFNNELSFPFSFKVTPTCLQYTNGRTSETRIRN